MANGNPAKIPSSYLQYLPELFRAPQEPGTAPFLGRFLKIFEALLSGRDDAKPMQDGRKITGLEEILDRYRDALDPILAPAELSADRKRFNSDFLTYLASWLALTLDQNWSLAKRRQWVQRIVPLYQRRGTRAALDEYLTMFVGSQARVDEPHGFVLGKVKNLKQTSTLGVDTFLGAPPYYFRVCINYGFPEDVAQRAGIGAEPFDINVWRVIRRSTQAIVDLEKPAHTYYDLDARAPGIILGFRQVNGRPVKQRATLGQDTLIWKNSRPI
jgi:phage tail-like protein